MPLTIYKRFSFDAAHHLPKLPSTHKCSRPHGHTYSLTCYFTGEPDERGFIVDYADIAEAVRPIVEQVDHQDLNFVWGLENPTTEALAMWFWKRIKPLLPQLSKVLVNESRTTGCFYAG